MFDAKTLDSFLDHVPDHVVVALDEAYYDFATDFARQRGVEYSHSLDYVKQERNIVVLRTFSKAHGLAADRVGYGFGPAELLGYVARLRTAFSVTSIGEAAAIAALDDEEHLKRALENNSSGAKFLFDHFTELGYKPLQTWGNFVYCDMHEDAAALSRRLQSEGVIIRPLNGTWGARTAIRVTVGTPEENEKFVTALKRVITPASVSK